MSTLGERIKKISIIKFQIPNNYQSTIFNNRNTHISLNLIILFFFITLLLIIYYMSKYFGHLFIDFWNLFAIWCLIIGN